jgi:hypothetical protein
MRQTLASSASIANKNAAAQKLAARFDFCVRRRS